MGKGWALEGRSLTLKDKRSLERDIRPRNGLGYKSEARCFEEGYVGRAPDNPVVHVFGNRRRALSSGSKTNQPSIGERCGDRRATKTKYSSVTHFTKPQEIWKRGIRSQVDARASRRLQIKRGQISIRSKRKRESRERTLPANQERDKENSEPRGHHMSPVNFRAD